MPHLGGKPGLCSLCGRGVRHRGSRVASSTQAVDLNQDFFGCPESSVTPASVLGPEASGPDVENIPTQNCPVLSRMGEWIPVVVPIESPTVVSRVHSPIPY